MPRKSAPQIQNELSAALRKLQVIGTDPSWQVSTRASLDYDGKDITCDSVIAVIRRNSLHPMKRIAAFSSPAITYRARWNSETLLFFVSGNNDLPERIATTCKNEGTFAIIGRACLANCNDLPAAIQSAIQSAVRPE